MKTEHMQQQLKLFVLTLFLLLLGLLILAPKTAVAQSNPIVTVQVVDSNGNNLENVHVRYGSSNGGFTTFGITGADGKATRTDLPDGNSYEFYVSFNDNNTHTSPKQTITINGDTTINFNTINTSIRVQTCSTQTPIAGAKVIFGSSNGGFREFGLTNANGLASGELFDGNQVEFYTEYNRTRSAKQTVPVTNGTVATFETTKVNLQHGSQILYGITQYSGWSTFTSPMELFAGTYAFKFGNTLDTNFEISGCSMDKTIAVLKLTDNNGNPLAGGTARGGPGNNFGQWHVPGSTDVNGILVDMRDGLYTNMSYEMKVNNTTANKTQNISLNPVFEFQTNLLTLRQETCAGTPLDGGNPRYGNGGTFTTWWFPSGATGSTAPGETASQVFPGSYSFQMQYQATADAKLNVNIPDADTTLTWQTTNIALNYSGAIAYGGGSGDSKHFIKPSMELLPGTVWFNFRGGDPYNKRVQLTFSGCNYEASAAVVKLLDSGGNGLSGGTAKYYDSGWKNIPGSTDTSGTLLHIVPSLKNNLRFRMQFAGGRLDKIQDIAADSFIIFQTENVVVNLQDSNATLGNLPEEGSVKYYASGWKTFGNTSGGTVSKELLPLNYRFRMQYAGGNQDKTQNVGNNSVVDFQTTLVTVNLKDSNGTLGNLPAEGTVKYYASGWKTFGNTSGGTVGKELLPLNYRFRMQYAGGNQDKTQNVGNNSVVDFQTTLVTVNLKDSNGTLGNLPEEGTVKYYASGWKNVGTTSGGIASKELLPLNYKFRMQYAGGSQDKTQNVGNNPVVDFQTALVTVRLQTGAGVGLSGGVAKYYASGWKNVGTTDSTGDTSKELLPLNYKFRMSYGGASNDKTQNVSVDPLVVFQAQNTLPTVQLLDSQGNGIAGGVVKYYASGWKTFGTTDSNGEVVKNDLLPGTYKFRMSYGGASMDITQDISDNGNPIVTFQTVNMEVQLQDSGGSLLDSGSVKYYASGWKSFGTTSGGTVSKELLPVSYSFRMSYEGGRQQISNVAIAVTNPLVFQTVNMEVQLLDSAGNPLDTGTVKYYASGWKSFGSTSGGTVSKELLPLSYSFRMSYEGGRQQISNVAIAVTNPLVFQTAAMEVQLKDSNGNPLDTGTVKYYASGWKSFGTTSGGTVSKELLPLSYSFRMGYAGGTEQKSNVNISGTNPLLFQTDAMVVQLQRCDATGLAGGLVKYYASGWKSFGTTDVNGEATLELLPINYSFRMSYGGATEQRSNVNTAVSPLTFNTTSVTLNYSGNIKYYASGWKTFTKPTMDMLPKTYQFRFDSEQTAVSISGCSIEQSVLFITLKDSNGAGVANGTARLGVSGWPVIGSTDANGELLYFHNGTLGNMKIRMGAPFYGGSQTSPVQDTTLNSTFAFQTSQVTIQLKDSAGDLINGGLVRAGVSGWPVIGSTGDDGLGTLYHERFAGTFKYRMGFNSSSEEQQQDVSTPFIFQTVQAVIQLLDHNGNPLDGGTVRFGVSGWPVIGTTGDDGPGTVNRELFAGSYNFRMGYNYATEQKNGNIAAPVIFQTALVDLQFSGNIRHKVSGWPTYASPTEMLPVNQGYGFTGCGYPRQELFFTPTAGTVFDKSMVFATFSDSNGDGLAGGNFEYRLGWGSYMPLGSSPTNGLFLSLIDGLHTNTKFRITYAGGTTGDMQQNIATDSCVNFQTVPVTAVLMNSDNTIDLSGDATFAYRYGWGAYVPFDGAEELLPITTKMRVSYAGGTTGDMVQNTGVDASFDFATVLVSAQLLASDGVTDLSNDATFEYRYGWGAYMPLAGDKELLPINIKMRTSYAEGTTGDVQQNVGIDPTFDFATVLVTAQLLASDSVTDLSNDATFEYRYGWGAYMPFDGAEELLPINIKMRTSYAGGRTGDVQQNVGSNAHFSWQTGKVTSGTNTATQYRYGWGAYQPFTNGMELLPLSTKFTFNDGEPETAVTVVSGATTNIH